jgi:hypothetical protein
MEDGKREASWSAAGSEAPRRFRTERELNQQGFSLPTGLLPTGGVNRPVARDVQEPGFGFVGNSIRRPIFQRSHQRLAQSILCVGNVAGARGDVGDQPAIRITRHGFNRLMRGGIAHR